MRFQTITPLIIGAVLLSTVVLPAHSQDHTVTGRSVSGQGTHTPVGSYPLNCLLSPDGKYVVVSDVGAREYLTVIRVADGAFVSRIAFNDDLKPTGKDGLYYGLVFGATKDGLTTLYASTGARDRVDVFTLDAEGYLRDTGKSLINTPTDPKASLPHHVAGIALNADGSRLYAVNNQTAESNGFKGSLSVLNTSTGTRIAQVPVGGFPFAVTAITQGSNADKKVYVGNERDSSMSVVNLKRFRSCRPFG
jgi:YVTN family beta-propeller protein